MFAVVVLCCLLIIAFVYIVFLKVQLHNINRQLIKRLTEQTRQSISLGLLDYELNQLAININKCLKAEENLRLVVLHEEKQFKEMIANISHDLRTPLTAIKGYLQLISKGSLEKEQRYKLEIAQRHADELGCLLEQFFEYSYLLNSQAQPQLEKLNLTNLTAECLAETYVMFEDKNLRVQFENTAPIFILADKEMVKRIIQNLIRNCIQHADSDVQVKLEADQRAVISFKNAITDSSEIDVNRLFERFYTGDKSRKRNTGLGLSIVKLLAEQMGGSAGAELQDGLLDIEVSLPL